MLSYLVVHSYLVLNVCSPKGRASPTVALLAYLTPRVNF